MIVKRSESFLKLGDLLFDDLVSHLLSNTISIDQELVWWVTLVLFLKLMNGVLDTSV